jgi:hypothetical protein
MARSNKGVLALAAVGALVVLGHVSGRPQLAATGDGTPGPTTPSIAANPDELTSGKQPRPLGRRYSA